MKRIALFTILMTLGVFLAAPIAAAAEGEEPKMVHVQHILVGFKRSVPGKKIARTKREAKLLAYQLLQRARDGEEFDTLVREHTDDSYPGLYVLMNHGEPRRPATRTRKSMTVGFGDVSFSLAIGEIGMVDFGPSRSPYGWHIVKRLELE